MSVNRRDFIKLSTATVAITANTVFINPLEMEAKNYIQRNWKMGSYHMPRMYKLVSS